MRQVQYPLLTCCSYLFHTIILVCFVQQQSMCIEINNKTFLVRFSLTHPENGTMQNYITSIGYYIVILKDISTPKRSNALNNMGVVVKYKINGGELDHKSSMHLELSQKLLGI